MDFGREDACAAQGRGAVTTTIHPIAIVNEAINEYRDHVLTEFRARDLELRRKLEEALDEPRFLAQAPFFQAHRAFRPGLPWLALGLDRDLARAVQVRARDPHSWFHQSEAITHLLGSSAGPIAVTTGTGSGKSECFLLPVLHNAIQDSVRFRQSGLTALLVYPMNALANDQEERIRAYLKESNHEHVRVGRYDRSTKEDAREAMRANPPHILLTNYVMLEYLLVRKADREALFANHRCRFAVLDEVHTYRGSLGANIALLFRRLRAHLGSARQDYQPAVAGDAQRAPALIPVATSATIKTVDETGRAPAEVRALRDEAVQGFFGTLAGIAPASIRVIGEELADVTWPSEAVWSTVPTPVAVPGHRNAAEVGRAVAALAGLPPETPVARSGRSAAILWKLGELLAKRPLSLEFIAQELQRTVPERQGVELSAIQHEVQVALVAGSALEDGAPGALRLRTHRFVRGGWRFHRCIDPTCGRLMPMGETHCADCQKPAAPLYLCRSCGADCLGFSGGNAPDTEPLVPAVRDGKAEWFLYDAVRLNIRSAPSGIGQMGGMPVVDGFFEPASGLFTTQVQPAPWLDVQLAPARTRCLVCGSRAGSHDVVTRVSLGTSAAVRVLCEGLVESLAVENRGRALHDGKERLLVFADSRQDAAHQARFISYAGRFDRMRRNLVGLLTNTPRLALSEAALQLMVRGRQDNPLLEGITGRNIPEALRKRATAWEEAPLLEDISVGSGYRATLPNLGLVSVRYDNLETILEEDGGPVRASLGLTNSQLIHVARCILDDIRDRGAIARDLLRYNPKSDSCPEDIRAADWERKLNFPVGYACLANGDPSPQLLSPAPNGIKGSGFWRAPGAGGMGPGTERRFRSLVRSMGAPIAQAQDLIDLLKLLKDNALLLPTTVFGNGSNTETLLQLNPDAILLELIPASERRRCATCGYRMAWATTGAPCPKCPAGRFEAWPQDEVERSRYVRRIRRQGFQVLVAREHTAQVTGDDRIQIEDEFKGAPGLSPVNVLSCSPTLEMGIDVGGLDAVVMRNVPPRPDNYAQRGGRAGRRTRVGVVISYARATPHDGYFFDRPAEMIAGEVPAPLVALNNRDVVMRHLNAITLGLAEPALGGRMLEYVSIPGELQTANIDPFIEGFRAACPAAARLALAAWGPSVLADLRLASEESLVSALENQAVRLRDVFSRVAAQVTALHTTIAQWILVGRGDRNATKAMELVRRILGAPSERGGAGSGQADDRSAGHPLRRLAEFGLFPGYEFPSEPATLRLLGEAHEEEPIVVERRFGLAQYCPDAPVHARGHRWKVVGLDPASPWNPRGGQADWIYTLCAQCNLRYQAQEPRCPRCHSTAQNQGGGLPAFEFGGFAAVRDDTPVLQEEDRFAASNLLRCHPQWDGLVASRFLLPSEWRMTLRRDEEVRWINEWKAPTPTEAQRGDPQLHAGARGFYLCPSCGRILERGPLAQAPAGRTRARSAPRSNADPFGHAQSCDRRGQPPTPLALVAKTKATTLRIHVDLPFDYDDNNYLIWGHSLGQALRIGMRQLYLLDGKEVEFELEPLWATGTTAQHRKVGTLTFVDGAVGGSGFLERAAVELHLVAQRALDHLNHAGCTTACYRCLKSYQNQRFHERLNWPAIVPHLEVLAHSGPTLLAPDAGDGHDPQPWLDAYAAGVGSPLELRFLRLFEQHGFQVEKQVPISVAVGGPVITIADFAVAARRLAIYVDSAAFHAGNARRRDMAIRAALVAAGWTVEVVRAADLAQGASLLNRLNG